MWYRIISYLKFLLRSTNQHGVHSPFVFDLVTKCFYDNIKYSDYRKINAFKNRITRAPYKIQVTDLGAGSKAIKTNERKVKDIGRYVCISKKEAKLLYRLIKYFEPENILELGTSLGFSTQALSLGNPTAKILTIEGCPNIAQYTKVNFDLQFLDNIKQLTGDFSTFLPELSKNSYDLIFFDGNHQKEATLNYFETLLTTIHNDSVFIFDDIYWSKGMTEAWETIKQHPKVTVTIDTYFWGLVFFRKEQQKEHFTIRV